MVKFPSLATLFLWLTLGEGYILSHKSLQRNAVRMNGVEEANSTSGEISRQQAFQRVVGSAFAVAFVPTIARADVYSGTSLPQGATQFQRVLLLQNDLKVSKTLSIVPAIREDLSVVLIILPLSHKRQLKSVYLRMQRILIRKNGITLESSLDKHTQLVMI